MLREARPRMRSVRCDDGAPGRRGARGAGAGRVQKKKSNRQTPTLTKEDQKKKT